jgi:DNA-binding LacI/PurR family transcriptional regulator
MSVSKVLHGRGTNVRVSEETAAVIRKVAADLEYRPNVLARNLRTRKTRTIGVVFDEIPQFSGIVRYFSDLLSGVTSAAFANNYSITLCNSLIGPSSQDRLFDGRFDGLLWVRMTDDNTVLRQASQARLPVVVFNEKTSEDPPNHSFVSWQNNAAAQAVAEHLKRLGHSRVAFVTGERSIRNPEATLRQNFFVRAWRSYGGEIRTEDLLLWSETAENFSAWWQKQTGVTALVVWSESLAIMTLEQARLTGVQVPRDLSVVGFDSSVQCDLTQPKLTAAHQPIREMAVQATNHLIQRIESPGTGPQHFVFPSVLDVRESTARPLNAEKSL